MIVYFNMCSGPICSNLFFGGVCSKRAGSTTSEVLLRRSSQFQGLALAARRSYVPFLFLENKNTNHRFIYDIYIYIL